MNITQVGFDLAKNVFQVHGIDERGKGALRKQLKRPQVHGAVRDALDYLGRVLDVELNSATDNPLIFPGGGAAAADVAATGGGLVISGGNFHGEPIALALDFAKLAIAELGAISERRIALLLDARLNGGLPPFLAPASGLNSGMMLLQYT